VFSGISSHFRETLAERRMGKAFVLRFARIATRGHESADHVDGAVGDSVQTAFGLQVS